LLLLLLLLLLFLFLLLLLEKVDPLLLFHPSLLVILPRPQVALILGLRPGPLLPQFLFFPQLFFLLLAFLFLLLFEPSLFLLALPADLFVLFGSPEAFALGLFSLLLGGPAGQFDSAAFLLRNAFGSAEAKALFGLALECLELLLLPEGGDFLLEPLLDAFLGPGCRSEGFAGAAGGGCGCGNAGGHSCLA